MAKAYARFVFLALSLLTIILVVSSTSAGPASTNFIDRVSISSDSTQGNNDSYYADISENGRYVTFKSSANNLVAGDNGNIDVFVRDRLLGVTALVSMDTNGVKGNSGSGNPSISADGRYVAFNSWANNLVPNDQNGALDVFVHDRQSGQTTRVSVSSGGVEGNDKCEDPAISADGRFVAFECLANNLVVGDDNDTGDIFVHDRHSATTTCVSVDSAGVLGNDVSFVFEGYGPAISADGRFVVFTSWATNLVVNDDNERIDIFLHDRDTGETTRVSVASDGTEANGYSNFPAMSADGRYVAFASDATNLVPGGNDGIFVYDRITAETTRILEGYTFEDLFFFYPSLSADGRYVAFGSDATDLVTGDTNDEKDIFVYDRENGATNRVSLAYDGAEGNSSSRGPVIISDDGKYVTFTSDASNLVPGDSNDVSDVFVAFTKCSVS